MKSSPTSEHQAPPPTRGWTCAARPAPSPPRGSPAHAGMDPSQLGRIHSVPGLPRPRGDGPARAALLFADHVAPPPTRGWTAPRRRRRDPGAGSPAHAGMGLDVVALAVEHPRLPRPRGDGPVAIEAAVKRGLAPPPTRGWTRRHSPGGILDRGSPAHAGMDRAQAPFATSGHWLPRPRGDGPWYEERKSGEPKAPPPTRGWTARDGRRMGHVPGSPAHAGMDPPCSRSRAGRCGLPRPRGDGPRSILRSSGSPSAPPPTRGWTGRRAEPREVDDGSPAHAGMDRSWYRPPSAGRRLPRPRGDGPSVVMLMSASPWAPPPTRGWTESGRAGGRRGARGLPRPRGDGPSWRGGMGWVAVAPPPTRGWTRRRDDVADHVGGSPAHAGMDPPCGACRAPPSGLPRPRGDGPLPSSGGRRSLLAPPPTRGWTLGGQPPQPDREGSPAHAGMDPVRRSPSRPT